MTTGKAWTGRDLDQEVSRKLAEGLSAQVSGPISSLSARGASGGLCLLNYSGGTTDERGTHSCPISVAVAWS